MRLNIPIALLFVGLLQASAPGTAQATWRRPVAGPVEARVIRVVDGDTILVAAEPWPQESIEVYVRLRGIDAPELHARCSRVRAAARTAKTALSALVAGNARVRLRDIGGGKYFGRVLASVETDDGGDLSEALLARRVVARYDGGKRHASDCAGG